MPDESVREYHVFNIYLNMPATKRSVVGAYRIFLHGSDDGQKLTPPPDIGMASRKYDWRGRAEAWDEKVRREQRDSYLAGIRHQAHLQGQAQLQVNEKLIRGLDSMAEDWIAMIETPLEESRWNKGHVPTYARAMIELVRYISGQLEEAENQNESSEYDRAFQDALASLDGGQEQGAAEEADGRALDNPS